MKKFIMIIISMMMLMPSMANAQIKKTGEHKTETLVSVRMGFAALKYDGGYYLAMQTSNQFDKGMILKLGDTKESALESLKDLVEILDSLQGNATQNIDNGYGKEFQLYKNMGALYFAADGYAGTSNLAKSELNKMIKALTK